jgi:thiamine-monophosphate kinase
VGLTEEQGILERVRGKVGASRMALGMGDDCAIFRPRTLREELVFTTDMLIEDVHFRRTTHTPAQIGHKALARGLSDIAAMGAEPRFCLLSVAFPKWADVGWIDRFFDGFLALARETGTELAGGDLAHSAKLTCDVVVVGSAPTGSALRRSGARPGDAVYVSGRLGASALGLATKRGAAWKRHLRPEPRLALGRYLRRRATAAMDLSDGLSRDLHRLCLASRVAAEITAPPLFRGASLEQALHGGEDYELLFTAPPRRRIAAVFAGVALTRIGAIRRGVHGEVRLNGEALPVKGYDHFST